MRYYYGSINITVTTCNIVLNDESLQSLYHINYKTRSTKWKFIKHSKHEFTILFNTKLI